MATAKDRITKIADPRQRALAARVGEVCDLFSEHFIALAPADRLVDAGRAEDDAGRLRNLLRMLALGMVASIGRELGLAGHDLHGLGKGRTEVVELRAFHHTTILNAMAIFGALVQDRGAFGRMIAGEYQRILRACQAEVEAPAIRKAVAKVKPVRGRPVGSKKQAA